MAYRSGVQKKPKKTYSLAWKRGGWLVVVLECEHAVLVAQAARKASWHVCSICTKAEAKKKPGEQSPRLLSLLKKYGEEEVLAALISREKLRKNLLKARAKRWTKKVEPISPEADLENQATG